MIVNGIKNTKLTNTVLEFPIWKYRVDTVSTQNLILGRCHKNRADSTGSKNPLKAIQFTCMEKLSSITISVSMHLRIPLLQIDT